MIVLGGGGVLMSEIPLHAPSGAAKLLRARADGRGAGDDLTKVYLFSDKSWVGGAILSSNPYLS